LRETAGGFDGRHVIGTLRRQSASQGGGFDLTKFRSTIEGVGETSGQTAGSNFDGLHAQKPIRQKKQVSSFGAVQPVRSFILGFMRDEIWS
jgi:hypothetical protein